jgi:Uma2 family endonuclease
MSPVDRPRRKALPPLVDGQRLDRPTFHERYEAMAPETRAELVGGVVRMPSPMRVDHGRTSRLIAGWLLHYQLATPGVDGADGASVKLDDEGEPQPDHLLLVPAELGGSCRVDPDGYLAGPPELVIEVARSTRAFDLGAKRADYERTGVKEYLVVAIQPDEVHWLVRREGRFTRREPGADGVHRSEVFPGLWLDAGALFAGDLTRLVAALDRGLATPEHRAFAEALAKARREGASPA